jgi:phosphate starvation-inducible PhoH-like protein
LKPKPKYVELSLTPADNRRLASLCGSHDEHLKQIEEYLGVEIANRGNLFRVTGSPEESLAASQLLKDLYDVTEGKGELTLAGVHAALQQLAMRVLDTESDRESTLRTPKRIVRGRGPRQRQYIRNILTHDINFGVGPAGTGKTYLAVACAVEALESSRVERILLVRPVVEAGERLGFLPGAIEQKIDPYLRPLYDALNEMLGFEKVARLLEKSVIELAPLAYMRGRTLNESFIILDEAQNTTPVQMKLFLTRMGENARMAVTGDLSQVDLPPGTESGLKDALATLEGMPGAAFIEFTDIDVVRNPMVTRIVRAYQARDRARESDGAPARGRGRR